jgi:hypothetical protein
MSEDTTPTPIEEGGADVADLITALRAAPEGAIFPELLSDLHQNGKCLALTSTRALIATFRGARSAFADAGITLRQHRVRGSRRLTLMCRERTAH